MQSFLLHLAAKGHEFAAGLISPQRQGVCPAKAVYCWSRLGRAHARTRMSIVVKTFLLSRALKTGC